VLLLCRFAAVPAQAAVLLRPALARSWLVPQPSKARITMRVFCTLFRQIANRAELMALREVPPFLAAALAAADREVFFAACWSVRIADGCSDYVRGLAESAVPDCLVDWVRGTAAEDLRALQAACAALITIADGGFSPAFLRVVQVLLKLVARGSPAIHHCLNLLERISQYRETLAAFEAANVAGVLAQLTAPDLYPYVRHIHRGLKDAGFVLPA
jgi:hypothetical protein